MDMVTLAVMIVVGLFWMFIFVNVIRTIRNVNGSFDPIRKRQPARPDMLFRFYGWGIRHYLLVDTDPKGSATTLAAILKRCKTEGFGEDLK